jgi:hypothetical protein
MFGRLGWHGQCSCCSGPAGKDTTRAQEERAWRAEALQEIAEGPSPVTVPDLGGSLNGAGRATVGPVVRT